MNFGQVKAQVVAYVSNTFGNTKTEADFIIPPITGTDILTPSINNVRRNVERLRDFRHAEADAYLSIPASGGALSDAYISSTVTVSGTLSPNVVGTWTLSGTHNSLPFYTFTLAGTTYFLAYNGSTAWTITAGAFTASSKWTLTTTSTSPAGAYTPTTYIGTATVAATTTALLVKRVNVVELPIASSNYIPIEFLTNDEWLRRIRIQTGRMTYSATGSTADYGVSDINPLAYQQGQSIFLYPPAQFTFPVTAKLNVVRFMPDYANSTDTDFFTQFAPDYLQWAAVLEVNKYMKEYTTSPRTEGNINEEAVQAFADKALAALIEWDKSINEGTSTPELAVAKG